MLRLPRLLMFVPILISALFPFALMQTRVDSRVLFGWTFLIGLASLFALSGPDYKFYYLQSNVEMSSPDSAFADPSFMHGRLVRWAWFALLLTALLIFVRKVPWWRWGLGLVLVGGIAWCGSNMWELTGGEPIYQDDHPSFMQRLHVFGQTFPQVLYYDSMWNAGGAQSYLVSSGTAAPGILAWPLWRFFPVHEVYTLGLMWLYLIVVPACILLATRLMGGGWTACLAAGALALGATRVVFRWQFQFGTLGFSVAMPFLVLAIACLYRLLYKEDTRWWVSALLVLSGYLYLCWPAGVVFAALPMVLVGLGGIRGLTNYKVLGRLLACMLALALLMSPYLFAVLNHSKVTELSKAVRIADGFDLMFYKALLYGHPLLLIGGLFGCVGLPGVLGGEACGRRRAICLALLGLVLTMGAAVFAPHLELVRASVPLFLVAILPASFLLESWLETKTERPLLAAPAAAGLGLIVLGVVTCADYYGNRAEEYYIKKDVAPETAAVKHTRFAYIDDFVAWAKTAPKDGRICFLGRTQEKYARAHSAYLPVWANHAMMAGDYYAFPEELYKVRMPPSPYFDHGIQGWMAYLQRYNVKYVVTFDQKHDTHLKDASGTLLDPLWVCRQHPHHFKEVFEFGASRKFYVFEVQNQATWFFGGENSGTVEAGINWIQVALDDPNQDVTIRFLWADGLRASGAATVAPDKVTIQFPGRPIEHDSFIRISPNGERNIRITYRKLF